MGAIVIGKKKVKRRILAVESSIMRGICLAMELELGLDSVRIDLTELRAGQKIRLLGVNIPWIKKESGLAQQ